MENEIQENVFKIVSRLDSWSSEHISPKVTMEIDSYATLSDVLGAFESFLKACGYFLPENKILDFVED